MLENAESDIVKRYGAERQSAYYCFAPIGREIQYCNHRHHDDKRQDIGQQYGFPSQPFAYFDFYFVTRFHRLQHDNVHLLLLTLGRHTHRPRFACRTGAGLHDFHMRHGPVGAQNNAGMSNQFLHVHITSGCKDTKSFSYTQARTYILYKNALFLSIIAEFSTFNF